MLRREGAPQQRGRSLEAGQPGRKGARVVHPLHDRPPDSAQRRGLPGVQPATVGGGRLDGVAQEVLLV